MQSADIKEALMKIKATLQQHVIHNPTFDVSKALQDFQQIETEIQFLVGHMKNLTPEDRAPLLEYIREMKDFLDNNMREVEGRIDVLSLEAQKSHQRKQGISAYQKKAIK